MMIRFLFVLLCAAAGIFAPHTQSATTISVSGDAVVGTAVNATVSYEVEAPLSPGSSIMLTSHWATGIWFQAEDPALANHVRIETDAEVEFSLDWAKRTGIHGGLESVVTHPVYTIESGELGVGDVVNLQVQGLQLPETSGVEFELPVFTKPPGGEFTRVPGTGTVLVPGKPVRLSVNAAATAATGEEIDLQVRLEDEFGNPAGDRTLSLDILVNGTFEGRTAFNAPVQAVPDIRFTTPGVYRVELRSAGGGLRGESNPILVGAEPFDIVWVDLGSTTHSSDGSLSASMLLEMNRAIYDVTLGTEHDLAVRSPQAFNSDTVEAAGLWLPLDEGGAVNRLTHTDGRSVLVGLPEHPTDPSRYSSLELRLAEVVSGNSNHLWFGEKLLSRGYPVGFVGSNHSHQYPGAGSRVYTAVRVSPGQDLFDALSSGQTYVTVGSKMTLLTSSEPLPLDGERRLTLRVLAENPVQRIELIKNGVTVDMLQPALPIPAREAANVIEQESGALELLLSVYSDSRPFSSLMTKPRNAREWIGFVQTRDTTLVVDSSEVLTVQRGNRQRADFLAKTHGNTRSLRITLQRPTADTVLEIGLAEVLEDAAWLPVDRLPQKIDAQRFQVPVTELLNPELLNNGTAVRTMNVGGYRDIISVALAGQEAALDVSHEYVDSSTPRVGDYYYYRVRLVNGAEAFTSPVVVTRPKLIPSIDTGSPGES